MCLRTAVYALTIALGLLCRVAYMSVGIYDQVPSEKWSPEEISALQMEADRLEQLRIERIVKKGSVK
jgi:cytochrome c-type biogenesis protein CcmH/NrfG